MSSNVAASMATSSFSGFVVSGYVPERRVAFVMACQTVESLPLQYQSLILEKLQQIEDVTTDLLPLVKRANKQAAA